MTEEDFALVEAIRSLKRELEDGRHVKRIDVAKDAKGVVKMTVEMRQ